MNLQRPYIIGILNQSPPPGAADAGENALIHTWSSGWQLWMMESEMCRVVSEKGKIKCATKDVIKKQLRVHLWKRASREHV